MKAITETYFETYTAAVQAARLDAENKGYEIDESSWFSQVNVGQGRPDEGKTSTSTVELLKAGKVQRKCLHIQVYNRGNDYRKCFELNFYIS